MDSDFNSIACEYQLLGPVGTKLEEFETRRVYSEKASTVCPGEEFKYATINGYLEFVFQENSVREITWLSLYRVAIVFERLHFQNENV